MDHMTPEDQANNHNALVMRELGDIKTSLAVNTNETSNIKSSVGKIEIDTKETKTAVQFQNGRMTKLEEWSKEAQKVIESTTKIASETLGNYRTDRVKIWTAVAVLLVVGGAVITLSIMAINTKIRDGINEAITQLEDSYDISIQ